MIVTAPVPLPGHLPTYLPLPYLPIPANLLLYLWSPTSTRTITCLQSGPVQPRWHSHSPSTQSPCPEQSGSRQLSGKIIKVNKAPPDAVHAKDDVTDQKEWVRCWDRILIYRRGQTVQATGVSRSGLTCTAVFAGPARMTDAVTTVTVPMAAAVGNYALVHSKMRTWSDG